MTHDCRMMQTMVLFVSASFFPKSTVVSALQVAQSGKRTPGGGGGALQAGAGCCGMGFARKGSAGPPNIASFKFFALKP